LRRNFFGVAILRKDLGHRGGFKPKGGPPFVEKEKGPSFWGRRLLGEKRIFFGCF